MTQTLNLSEKAHTSRVLSDWAASRPGAAKRMGVQNATVISSNVDGMNALFHPISSPSGFAVTDATAMQVTTVFACLQKLGGAVVQLPIEQYRLLADSQRKPIKRNALWYLLNETPAPAWTAGSWKQWIVKCVHLRGDQCTEIVRSRAGSTFGDVAGLKIHHPDRVQVRRVGARLVFDVQDVDTGKAYTVDQDDMLYFNGFGFDGMKSLSAIQYAARGAIGNALAGADYSGRSIGEGAMPQIALSYPNAMDKDQSKQLRDSFVATYGSGTGARKLPLVLANGGTVHELSMSPVDMELMASRQFEKEEICQALGVPGILIGDNSKTSSWGTGIEQITLGFVKYTIKPLLRVWQEELNRKLFRNAGPFLEFDLDALLLGDSAAQTAAFKGALGGPGSGDGYMAVNEVRKIKNLPAIKDPAFDKPFKAAGAPAAAAPTDPEPAPTEGNP